MKALALAVVLALWGVGCGALLGARDGAIGAATGVTPTPPEGQSAVNELLYYLASGAAGAVIGRYIPRKARANA